RRASRPAGHQDQTFFRRSTTDVVKFLPHSLINECADCCSLVTRIAVWIASSAIESNFSTRPYRDTVNVLSASERPAGALANAVDSAVAAPDTNTSSRPNARTT